jgi:hypothetical protein
MKLSRATIALYVGLVFVCGGVVGFFANRLYTATTVTAKNADTKAKMSPEEFRKYLVGVFRTRLKLSDDQVQQFNIILDETQAQVNAIHAQEDPQIDAVRASQITRMKLMLNPEQQTEYDKMLQERRERQKQQDQQRGGRRPGGPGL